MKNLFLIWFTAPVLIYTNLLAEDWMDDMSLVLPMNEPEQLVEMTGLLELITYDSNPENPEEGQYTCWILNLDQNSFEKTHSTPVHGAFQSPKSIREHPDCRKLALTGNYDETWLQMHSGQTITLSGYLWHAHTIHHNTPVMMDTDPW
jgi:hypothetical protein